MVKIKKLATAVTILLLLPLWGCSGLLGPGSPESTNVALVEQVADENGEDKLLLDRAISKWIGEAPEPEDRALRAGLLLAGLSFAWDARLKYGQPAVEDYDLAFTAFTRFDAIAERLHKGVDRFWINAQMYEIAVQVGTLVGRSVYARGRRAVTAALINPLSLLEPAQDVAVQVGAMRAAGLDVKALWEKVTSGEVSRDEAWAAVLPRIALHQQRLAAYMGLTPE